MGNVIKLGAAGALRNYSLRPQGSGIAWSRGPANPFSAKVNTASKYDEVDAWNEWIQEDWQTGVGRVDPEGGGFLYAEAETRVPGQVILPPLLQVTDTRETDGTTADCRYVPENVTSTVTLDVAGAIRRAAIAFVLPNPIIDSVMTIRFYLQIASGDTITPKIYSDTSGLPDTLLATGTTITESNPTPQFKWYVATISTAALSHSTTYFLSMECTGSGTQAACGSTGYNSAIRVYNGTAWSAIDDVFLLHITNAHRPAHATGNHEGLFRFNGETYLYGEESLSKYVPADNNWASVGTITGDGNITSAVVFGPEVHFGRSSGNYTTMNTSEAFNAESVTRRNLLEYKGILYGSWQNDLYYTADGSTWTGPFTVGGDDVEVRGMAGMGDSLYLATDKALMRFAPGDVVEEITRFGVEDNTNGVNMLAYNGRIYIPMQGRLFRFDPSGQLQDIWVSQDNDLARDKLGAVTGLTVMNNWLVARVVSPIALGRISLWIWQEEGWHFLADVGQHITGPSPITQPDDQLLYDRENSCLWVFMYGFLVGKLDIDDYTINPYNASGYLYMPRGWLEQDKFYGGLYLVDKAFDSVTIVGDNLSTNVHVKVYWQDEGSTAWELLGTIDSDAEELRWPISTRPVGRWIKLGLLPQTNDGDETPRIRAVVVKYLPYPNDRVRDTVTLQLKSNIQMPDGDPDDYTCAQQITHIESMIATVGTIIYTDPFNVSYEVAIINHSWTMPTFAYENGANVVKEIEVTLTLEQIPDGTYTP